MFRLAGRQLFDAASFSVGHAEPLLLGAASHHARGCLARHLLSLAKKAFVSLEIAIRCLDTRRRQLHPRNEKAARA